MFLSRPAVHAAFVVCALCAGFGSGRVSSQNLPPPSSTVFKCEANGRIVYTDSPCMGAQRIEIDPTPEHRVKLTPEAQRECQRFDTAIPRAEGEEKRATKATIAEAQRRLFDLRTRFRDLGC